MLHMGSEPSKFVFLTVLNRFTHFFSEAMGRPCFDSIFYNKARGRPCLGVLLDEFVHV